MNIRFFQEGGAMAPDQGQDPMQQIVEAAAQAVQANDPNMAMQVCQAIVQLAQGGAGQEASAPEGEGAPEETEEQAAGGEPVFRRGGKLVGFIR